MSIDLTEIKNSSFVNKYVIAEGVSVGVDGR